MAGLHAEVDKVAAAALERWHLPCTTRALPRARREHGVGASRLKAGLDQYAAACFPAPSSPDQLDF
eukprot:COSAG02_NODE_44975_length_361_cov_0.885496_1_plen_65_part_10